MTREEAIKIIDCYDIGFYDLSGQKITADKLAEAFDMAIEALSTERTGEWIADDGDATCSHCQRLFKGTKYDRMYNEKFCPSCGAKMDKE